MKSKKQVQSVTAPIKILHSSETVQGGVGSYMRILSSMPDHKVRQLFFIPSEHKEYLLPGDSRVRTFPQKKRGFWGCLRQAKCIQNQIKKEAPDIIFLHSSLSLVSLFLLRLKRVNIPIIYCPHGWAISRYRGAGKMKVRAIRVIEGRLAGLADLILNVSYNDTDIAKSLGYSGNHATVENAVPPSVHDSRSDMFSDQESSTINLLFVGRLDKQKGLDILIPAFKEACRHRQDLRLYVVGSAVRSDGTPLVFPEGVVPVGWVNPDRIDDYYRSADALVVPSRWEGLPLVIPEALRNGTPVLCSSRSGMEKLIVEGETGYSFSLNIEDLTNVLLMLDKKKIKGMGPECIKEYHSRFSIDRLSREIFEQYRMLLG